MSWQPERRIRRRVFFSLSGHVEEEIIEEKRKPSLYETLVEEPLRRIETEGPSSLFDMFYPFIAPAVAFVASQWDAEMRELEETEREMRRFRRKYLGYWQISIQALTSIDAA